MAEGEEDTELGEERGGEAIVKDEVAICLDLEQENIQQQYHCIKLHILVQHTFTLDLHTRKVDSTKRSYKATLGVVLLICEVMILHTERAGWLLQ